MSGKPCVSLAWPETSEGWDKPQIQEPGSGPVVVIFDFIFGALIFIEAWKKRWVFCLKVRF